MFVGRTNMKIILEELLLKQVEISLKANCYSYC